MEENLARVRRIFSNDGTLRVRFIENNHGTPLRCCLIYVEGMIDRALLQNGITKPVMAYPFKEEDCGNPAELIEKLRTEIIALSDITVTTGLDEVVGGIVGGNTRLLLDGYAGALSISTQGLETRAIEEPTTEKAVRGPREGFTESLFVNLTLIRRKVQNPDLKFVFRDIGSRTKTQTCICYMA
ncbi:hypothetical protein AMQ83_09735, partial [Paenibacillus riograndensis]